MNLVEMHRQACELFGAQVSAEREADYRGSGAIGPRPELPAGAGPQSRLLAAFGAGGRARGAHARSRSGPAPAHSSRRASQLSGRSSSAAA
jgi:hypothetical protein